MLTWAIVLGGLVPHGRADTLLVPSITVSERYDTNVFFFGAGTNLSDYVTTISPSLLMEHKGRIIEGTATATVTGEIYAKNPGLNYVAPSGSVSLNLDQLIGRLDRRAKLTFTDSLSYTPRPPGFLAPDTGSAVPADFVRGIQAIRANSLTNIATVGASYGITAASSLLASYTNTYLRFGRPFLPQASSAGEPLTAPAFFTTRSQITTVGPEVKVTPRDVFTASFQRMQMEFEGLTLADGSSLEFETKGGLLGWKRALTQKWTASASVGLSILTPGNDLNYLANASVEWRHKKAAATLSYSRTVFPGFFLAARPLLSQVLTLSGSHQMTESLTATASVSYARNETIPSTFAKFQSYAMSGSLSYAVSRTLHLIGSYSHYQFDQSFVGTAFSFDRDVLMMTLRKEWR